MKYNVHTARKDWQFEGTFEQCLMESIKDQRMKHFSRVPESDDEQDPSEGFSFAHIVGNELTLDQNASPEEFHSANGFYLAQRVSFVCHSESQKRYFTPQVTRYYEVTSDIADEETGRYVSKFKGSLPQCIWEVLKNIAENKDHEFTFIQCTKMRRKTQVEYSYIASIFHENVFAHSLEPREKKFLEAAITKAGRKVECIHYDENIVRYKETK